MVKKSLHLSIAISFFLTSLNPYTKAYADTVNLPQPGTMVNLSPAYDPVIIKGLTVHKDNPFLFDFIVDVGQDNVSGEPLKKEGEKLIKYFLASLAIPDRDLWVNLSPYERNKIVPGALGRTEMGRDLLEEDYILKQITASLIYPEKQLGKTFWDTVYAKAREEYGTTQIPVNTFNKVWIMADRAEVFEHGQTAVVVDSHLKVMLEEDYLALQKHQRQPGDMFPAQRGTCPQAGCQPNEGLNAKAPQGINRAHSIAGQIVRSIILPQLEKEVNTGKNFANLRQIFNSIILASWYKRNLKQALLNQYYADKSKINGIQRNVAGIQHQDLSPDDIYAMYLKAYKKGVFNYIKEEPNLNGDAIPRKYFSGGFVIAGTVGANPTTTRDAALLAAALPDRAMVDFSTVAATQPSLPNAAETVENAKLSPGWMSVDDFIAQTEAQNGERVPKIRPGREVNIKLDGGRGLFGARYIDIDQRDGGHLFFTKGSSTDLENYSFEPGEIKEIQPLPDSAQLSLATQPIVTNKEQTLGSLALSLKIFPSELLSLNPDLRKYSQRINLDGLANPRLVPAGTRISIPFDPVFASNLNQIKLNLEKRIYRTFIINKNEDEVGVSIVLLHSDVDDSVFKEFKFDPKIMDVADNMLRQSGVGNLYSIETEKVSKEQNETGTNIAYLVLKSKNSTNTKNPDGTNNIDMPLKDTERLLATFNNLNSTYPEMIAQEADKLYQALQKTGMDRQHMLEYLTGIEFPEIMRNDAGTIFVELKGDDGIILPFYPGIKASAVDYDNKKYLMFVHRNSRLADNPYLRTERDLRYFQDIRSRLLLKLIKEENLGLFRQLADAIFSQENSLTIPLIETPYVNAAITVALFGTLSAANYKLDIKIADQEGKSVIYADRRTEYTTEPIGFSSKERLRENNKDLFDAAMAAPKGLVTFQYIAQEGDKLPDLSVRYDESVERLIQNNPKLQVQGYLYSRNNLPLTAGEEITITAPLDREFEYIVRPDDSIASITTHFGIKEDAFRKRNRDILIHPWDRLKAGTPVKINLSKDRAMAAAFDYQRLSKDHAQAPGGIDLNTSSGMQWKVSKDGEGVVMNFDPAVMAQIKAHGINYLSPVILKMTPVTSIWPLIGLKAPPREINV